MLLKINQLLFPIIFLLALAPFEANSQTLSDSKESISLDKLAGVPFNFILSNQNDSVKINFTSTSAISGKKISVLKSYNGTYFASVHEQLIGPSNLVVFSSSKSSDKSLFYKIYLSDPLSGNITDSSKVITVFGTNMSLCYIYLSKTKGEVLIDIDRSFIGHTPRVIVTDASTGSVIMSKVIKEVDKTEKIKILSGKDKLGTGSYNVSVAFKKETFSQRLEVK